MRLISMPLSCVILVMGVLQDVAASFHAAMRPEEYLAHNEQLWDAMHDMLAPQAPAPLRRLPYPFRASMLALLSAELPHFIAAAGDGGAGAAGGASAVVGSVDGYGIDASTSQSTAQKVGERLAAPHREGWGAATLETLVLREVRAVANAEVSPDMPLLEAGLDSLALVELVSRLSEASGLQVILHGSATDTRPTLDT